MMYLCRPSLARLEDQRPQGLVPCPRVHPIVHVPPTPEDRLRVHEAVQGLQEHRSDAKDHDAVQAVKVGDPSDTLGVSDGVVPNLRRLLPHRVVPGAALRLQDLRQEEAVGREVGVRGQADHEHEDEPARERLGPEEREGAAVRSDRRERPLQRTVLAVEGEAHGDQVDGRGPEAVVRERLVLRRALRAPRDDQREAEGEAPLHGGRPPDRRERRPRAGGVPDLLPLRLLLVRKSRGLGLHPVPPAAPCQAHPIRPAAPSPAPGGERVVPVLRRRIVAEQRLRVGHGARQACTHDPPTSVPALGMD
mmetsp:Transcript_34055/g.92197  ORF Transcript_34055/g.92197 Transcript_34055/m.92197 type:complete len:306 (-) Transcript_34055:12-929(-)